MIFDAYLSINDFIFMHVIILICIFLLLYEKSLYYQKYFKIRVKDNDFKMNKLITHLYFEIIDVFRVNIMRESIYRHLFIFS